MTSKNGQAEHKRERDTRQSEPVPGSSQPELISIRTASKLAALHPSTLRRYVRSGDFPSPVCFGRRGLAAAGPRKDGKPRNSQAVRFWRHEVEEFLRTLPRVTELEGQGS